MMFLESPCSWPNDTNDVPHHVKKMIRRSAQELAQCAKPKCRARRYFFVGISYHQLGMKDEAKESLEKAFEYVEKWTPATDEVMLRKKVLEMLISKMAEELGLKVRPGRGALLSAEERAMFYFLKGKFYYDTFHPLEAGESFEQSLTENPESDFVLVSFGMALRSRRRAIDRFLKPSSLEHELFRKKLDRTSDVRAASRLAVIMMEDLGLACKDTSTLSPSEFVRRWKEILELAEGVAVADGAKPNDLCYAADIFLRSPRSLGKRSVAEGLYKRAIELNPNSSFAHHKLGKLLIFDKKVDEGLAHLLQAVGPDYLNLPAYMDYLGVKAYLDNCGDMESEFQRAKDVCRAGSHWLVKITVKHAQYKAWKGDSEEALKLLCNAAAAQESMGSDAPLQFEDFPPTRFMEVTKPEGKREDSGATKNTCTKAQQPALKKTPPSQLSWRRGADEGPRASLNRSWRSSAGAKEVRLAPAGGCRERNNQADPDRAAAAEEKKLNVPIMKLRTIDEIKQEIEKKMKA